VLRRTLRSGFRALAVVCAVVLWVVAVPLVDLAVSLVAAARGRRREPVALDLAALPSRAPDA
jgi:hypothetical protein